MLMLAYTWSIQNFQYNTQVQGMLLDYCLHLALTQQGQVYSGLFIHLIEEYSSVSWPILVGHIVFWCIFFVLKASKYHSMYRGLPLVTQNNLLSRLCELFCTLLSSPISNPSALGNCMASSHSKGWKSAITTRFLYFMMAIFTTYSWRKNCNHKFLTQPFWCKWAWNSVLVIHLSVVNEQCSGTAMSSVNAISPKSIYISLSSINCFIDLHAWSCQHLWGPAGTSVCNWFHLYSLLRVHWTT